ncbi:DUF3039 domain-containing protein [Euzebya tangerina]|uniref:DUF3039 domain-containing protein n=1 Tax=Euzebya tangerina TaxID=591198 RepID=UPI000E31BD43|nr:DUF3039 domain-containing protein [Euzebya tangerina]
MADTITTPQVAPDIDEETRVDQHLDPVEPGDHDRFAHYVFGRNPRAKVTKAMVTGTPIRALCGKKWVPSRDGSKFPVCPDCIKIKNRMMRGGDDAGE